MALIFVPSLQLLAGKLDFGFLNQLSIIVTIEEAKARVTLVDLSLVLCPSLAQSLEIHL